MEEYEVNGKKVILDTEFDENETDTARPEGEENPVDLEKTHQIDIVYDPASLDNTLTNIFKDSGNDEL